VLALCNRGWSRWFAGQLDEARADCRAAVDRARALEHPHSLAFALSLLTSVHQGRREPEEALAAATEVASIAGEHGFPYWTTWSQILAGWATAQLGEARRGIDEIEAALAAYRATGAEGMAPYFIALLAEALLLDAGKERALVVIDEGLAIAREHEINFYGPELLRLRARLSGGEAAREAIEWSRRLGARTLELRAALELATFEPQATAELAAVRALFTDDPRLPDLAAADARLGQASGADR
jgi:predicted ATPase